MSDTNPGPVRYAVVLDRGHYGSGSTVRPRSTHDTLEAARARCPRRHRVVEYDPEWKTEWLGWALDRFPTAT